jgi:hypothetical protein
MIVERESTSGDLRFFSPTLSEPVFIHSNYTTNTSQQSHKFQQQAPLVIPLSLLDGASKRQNNRGSRRLVHRPLAFRVSPRNQPRSYQLHCRGGAAGGCDVAGQFPTRYRQNVPTAYHQASACRLTPRT